MGFVGGVFGTGGGCVLGGGIGDKGKGVVLFVEGSPGLTQGDLDLT